jgi:hypothetical protein
VEVSVKHFPSRGAALIILSLSLQGVARAQALHVPPIEIGGQAGLFGAFADGVFVQPIVGPRLTFNISQRHAIELAADTLISDDMHGLYGFYFLQYKHLTRRPPNWNGIRPFVTGGAGGYYSYQKVPERRSPRPDGSAVVYPAFTTGELSRLAVAAFGGGFERALNRYASFRLEGTGFLVIDSDGFLGFRVLAGVSVPIGGYRATQVH